MLPKTVTNGSKKTTKVGNFQPNLFFMPAFGSCANDKRTKEKGEMIFTASDVVNN